MCFSRAGLNRHKALVIFSLLFLLFGGSMESFAKEPDEVKIFSASTGQVEEVEKMTKSDAEWKRILTLEQ